MPVEIKIYHETALQVLEELQTLSSGLTERSIGKAPELAMGYGKQHDSEPEAAAENNSDGSTVRFPHKEVVGAVAVSEDEFKAQTTRERGQPSPGKARRTKAEIAEDEAAEKADAAEPVDESGQSSGMSISSGEERVSPEDEADAAQDAADEAAETESHGGLQPRERLRKALGSLGIKAGVEAVKPGGLIGMTIDQVPEDEIEAMIAKVEAAKAAPTEEKAKEPEVKPATKDDLMQAMLDYAEVFDGTRDPSKAALAAEDCGKVFQMIFGEDVKKISVVPADGYDKAIAGIKEAIEKNPFKRERKG